MFERDPDWFVDRFERTVTMSTYLVAFVVSNFKSIKMNSPKHQIEIEVYARPEAIDNGEGEYALNAASNMIDFFIDYFNISYPMQKMSNFSFI